MLPTGARSCTHTRIGADAETMNLTRSNAERPGDTGTRTAANWPAAIPGLNENVHSIAGSPAKVRARGLLLEGVAHDQIVRAARRKKADLLVLGTHGRTGVARFFLGSVAGRVVASAPCPVLTVRGK